MEIALVLGVNGQDGRFVAKHLLDRKWRVVGIGRQERCAWQEQWSEFVYEPFDLRRTEGLGGLLRRHRPELIVHVAAVHVHTGGVYEPVLGKALQVNVCSVEPILEYMRQNRRSCRLLYASSGKVFGEPFPNVINEKTEKVNRDLYAITKNTAGHLIDYYRRRHGVRASIIYFFNHESEFHRPEFFVPKVLACLARAMREPAHVATINTLDFFCDWGSADEYMEVALEVLDQVPGEDFVVGTGRATYARRFVADLFNEYGLDYLDHIRVKIEGSMNRGDPYQVDTAKLVKVINRSPCIDIYKVSRHILKVVHGIGPRAECCAGDRKG